MAHDSWYLLWCLTTEISAARPFWKVNSLFKKNLISLITHLFPVNSLNAWQRGQKIKYSKDHRSSNHRIIFRFQNPDFPKQQNDCKIYEIPMEDKLTHIQITCTLHHIYLSIAKEKNHKVLLHGITCASLNGGGWCHRGADCYTPKPGSPTMLTKPLVLCPASSIDKNSMNLSFLSFSTSRK